MRSTICMYVHVCMYASIAKVQQKTFLYYAMGRERFADAIDISRKRRPDFNGMKKKAINKQTMRSPQHPSDNDNDYSKHKWIMAITTTALFALSRAHK